MPEKKKKGICRNRTDFYSIILCTCWQENSRGSGLIKQLHRRLFPFTIKLCASSIANMSALRRGDLAGVGVCVWRSLLSPTVSDRKLVFPSGSERFCSETLISARNAASVKSEPIFEIARNFSEHIPIHSEQLVGITRI